MQVATVGIDLAKNIFHVHCVDQAVHVIFSKPLRRAQMGEFFARLAPCPIGMQACSGAHSVGPYATADLASVRQALRQVQQERPRRRTSQHALCGCQDA